MEISFDYFRDNFCELDIDIIEIRKHYFYKYIELNLDDGRNIRDLVLVKLMEDQKKLYKSVSRYFSNFPIGKQHDENLIKILTFAREELRKGRTLLIEFIYAYFFKTKNYKKYKKDSLPLDKKELLEPVTPRKISNSKSESTLPDLDSLIDEKKVTTSDRKIEVPKNEPAKIHSSRSSILRSTRGSIRPTLQTDPIKKLFRDLFMNKGEECSTTYQRLLFYEHLLNSIEVKRTRSCVYDTQFGFSCEEKLKKRVVNFSDMCMFLYKEERNFLTDKYDFSELIVLIKIEKISFRDNHIDNETIITIKLDENLTDFIIIVKMEDKISFLFSFCVTIMQKRSIIIDTEKLPFPLLLAGSFILDFEEFEKKGMINADQADKIVTIENEYFRVSFESGRTPKQIILPLINTFDVFHIKTKRDKDTVEVFEILELNFNHKTKLKDVGCCRVSGRRLSRYMGAFTYEHAYNYQEGRYLKLGIKRNVKETKFAIFRLKRLIAYRIKYIKYLSEYLSFKYPVFTTVTLLFSLLINYFYSFGVLFLILFFCLLLYNHPDYKPKVDEFLDYYFFDDSMLHKSFKKAVLLTENQASREYYIEINNINVKSQDTSSLKDKINSAVGVSGKIPVYVHYTVDYVEKVINIILWKNKRKTEITLFMLIISCLAIYLFSLRILYFVYVGMRFVYGYGYFTRVKKWNEKIIAFLIPYFIIHVLGYKNVTCCHEFFKKYENDDEIKTHFSKKFSESIYKWLSIKTDEMYWKEYFRYEEIHKILVHSEKRYSVPFYPEVKKPGFSYQSTFFLLSTPSDFYFVNVKNNRSKKKTKVN